MLSWLNTNTDNLYFLLTIFNIIADIIHILPALKKVNSRNAI